MVADVESLSQVDGADTDRFIDGIVKAAESDQGVDRKHAHAMFLGPGESGKTSLMNRLRGKKELASSSTGVSDPVVIADVNSGDASSSDAWQIVVFEESLVGQMHGGAHDLRSVILSWYP